jgi:hypothetical protein
MTAMRHDPAMRCVALMLLALIVAAPASAQQRVVVVPADTEVAVPARGAQGPRLVTAPRPRIPARGGANSNGRLASEDDVWFSRSSLVTSALIALPIAALAAVTATIPGRGNGGGNTSAPARTR